MTAPTIERESLRVEAPRPSCPAWCRDHEVYTFKADTEECHLVDSIVSVENGTMRALVVQFVGSDNEPSALVEFTPNDGSTSIEFTADLPLLTAAVSALQGIMPALTGGAR